MVNTFIALGTVPTIHLCESPIPFLPKWNPNGFPCQRWLWYWTGDWNFIFLVHRSWEYFCVTYFLLHFLLYYSVFYFHPSNSQSIFSANLILLASFPNLIKVKFVTLSSLESLPICNIHKSGSQQEGSWVKKPRDMNMSQRIITITNFQLKKKEESNGHSRRQILKAKGEKHIIKPDKSKMA